MGAWKIFNELTVGISFGSFAVLWLFILIKAVPSIIKNFKEETGK